MVDYSQTLPVVPIPVSIFTLRLEPTISVRISGEISGNIAYSETVRKGFNASVSPNGVQMKSVDEIISPGAFTGELSQWEGNMSAGLELRPTLGIGFIGDIYGSLSCSFDVTASADMQNQPEEENPDSMHLCDLCFDGDISATGRVSCGLEIQLLTKAAGKLNEIMDNLLGEGVYEIHQTQPEITLLEMTKKLGDFYLSIPDLDKTDSHFDWGDCPNIRYRTTVTLQTEGGDPASGATVTASFPDQQKAEATADENGIAVIYLPTGDNELTGKYENQIGTGNVIIEDAPDTVDIILNHRRELCFIIYYEGEYLEYTDDNGMPIPTPDDVSFDSSAFPEVEQYLQQRYPYAHFLDSENYSNPFEIGYLEQSYLRQTFPELNDGDLIIYLRISRIMNEKYQKNRYAIAPFHGVTIEIYQMGSGGNFHFYWMLFFTTCPTLDDNALYTLEDPVIATNGGKRIPIKTDYKYVLSYLNDTAGAHKLTMGFVEEACGFIDTALEGREE